MGKQSVQYMLAGDVARVLDVARQTVVWLEKRGRLKADRTTRGVRLFRVSTVQAELERRKKLKTTSELK
jgi:DNA-binding transcriptional MerR regulator